MSAFSFRRGLSSITSLVKPFVTESVREGLVDLLVRGLKGSAISYRQTSDREDVRTWWFDRERTYEFTRPVGVGELPQEIERLLGTHHCHQPFVIEVPNVVIKGPNGLKITEDGRYLTFNYSRRSLTKASVRELAYDVLYGLNQGEMPELNPQLPTDAPVIDVAVSLLGKHATNYTHWIQESLTLLEGFEEYRRRTGNDPTILVPPDPPSFVTESLETLGYTDADYVEWDYDRLRVNRLVLPSLRRCLITSTERFFRMFSGLDWVRNRSRPPTADLESDRRTSRILISREDASARRIVNRDEVDAALAERGFETVVTGELSYADQVRLFADAEFVVGTHGAGMVNNLYSDDSKVIELYGDHYLPANYEIAQGLGLRYGCLECGSIGDDIRVDIDELLDAIERMEAI